MNSVLVDDVKYIICNYWEGKMGKNAEMIPAKRFRLLLEKDTVEIKLTLHRKSLLFQKIQMIQFEIEVNIAITGHKLQGARICYIPYYLTFNFLHACAICAKARNDARYAQRRATTSTHDRRYGWGNRSCARGCLQTKQT